MASLDQDVGEIKAKVELLTDIVKDGFSAQGAKLEANHTDHEIRLRDVERWTSAGAFVVKSLLVAAPIGTVVLAFTH